MTDDTYTVFVFEGERAERQIYQSLSSSLLFDGKKNTHIISCYCAEVYQLYQEICEDENLDFFMLLREQSSDDNFLKIPRNKVAQIYLFFDYDGHATNANDEKIDYLLGCFDEESNQGKLYISYPMVESLKHINESVSFKDVVVDCKKNISYKSLVGQECDYCFQALSRLNLTQWRYLIYQHLSKLNYLLTNNFVPPNEGATQLVVFQNQLEKYIQPQEKVAVLSAFPLFLADYYGYSELNSYMDGILMRLDQSESY